MVSVWCFFFSHRSSTLQKKNQAKAPIYHNSLQLLVLNILKENSRRNKHWWEALHSLPDRKKVFCESWRLGRNRKVFRFFRLLNKALFDHFDFDADKNTKKHLWGMRYCVFSFYNDKLQKVYYHLVNLPQPILSLPQKYVCKSTGENNKVVKKKTFAKP